VHLPSLGGGPMTTMNKNKSAATATKLANVTFCDVAKFNTRSSSS